MFVKEYIKSHNIGVLDNKVLRNFSTSFMNHLGCDNVWYHAFLNNPKNKSLVKKSLESFYQAKPITITCKIKKPLKNVY